MDSLIIGLGNPDCGDDAAGLLVARGLAELGLTAMAHTGSPIDLLDLWHGAERVVLVDALMADEAIGNAGALYIWRWPDGPLRTTQFRSSSTHGLGLTEAIHLAAALGRLPHDLTTYGIPGAQFAAGATPSRAVLTQVRHAVETIAATLRKCGRT